MSRGFTYVELILTLGIIAIIVASSVPFMSSFYLQNNFDSDSSQLISLVRKAQQYAMADSNSLTWGICLSSGIIRLYGGSCASPTIKNDLIPASSLVITGLSDFTFSPHRGEPSTVQTIILSNPSKSKTIMINAVGGLSVN